MAERKIKLVFEIAGDKEYRDAVRNTNAEQKKLASELDVTKSAYATNANSMDALTAKQKNYSDIITALEKKQDLHRTGINNAREAVEKYTKQLAELTTKQTKLTAEYGENSAEALENAKSIEKVGSFLELAQRRENDYTAALNKTTVELGKYTVEQDKNSKHLAEAAIAADGCAKSIDQYGNEVKEATPTQQNMNRSLESLAHILIAAGIQKGFNELVDLLKSTVSAAIEFESALTGVFKTVDGTPEQLKNITLGIKELSTEIPVATTEIAAVAEAAGQLGIATDDVLVFSRVMLDLGVSTNLSSEQAATSLAKFANIAKMAAGDYERLGSTVVALGNNFATTEADIVNMATKIASTGTQVGLTEPQIIALATALSSVGMEAEAGGSAVSKLMKNIEVEVKTGGGKLEQFASVANMTAEEFTQAWGENAVNALGLFVSGLNDVERNGKSSIEILDEMEITEIRTSDAALRLSNAFDVMTSSQDMANQAWAENTALATEAELRYGTTESKIQLLNNSVELLKIAIGEQLTPVIRNFIDAGDGGVRMLTDWVQANEWIVPTITALTAALGTLITAVTGAMVISKLAAAIMAVVNPVGLAVAAVAALTAGVIAFAAVMPNANAEYKQFTDNIEKSTSDLSNSIKQNEEAYRNNIDAAEKNKKKSEELIDTIDELNGKKKLSTQETYELKRAVELLNQIMPELKLHFDENNNSVIGYTKSLRNLAEAHYLVAKASAEQANYNVIRGQIDDTQENLNKITNGIQDYAQTLINLGYVLQDGSLDRKKLDDLILAPLFDGSVESEAYKAIRNLEIQEKKTSAVMTDLNAQMDESLLKLEEIDKKQQEYNDTIEENTNITEDNIKAVGDYTKSVSEATGVKREYAEQLKTEDNAIKTLKSEYDLINTKYANNANTTEALKEKHNALNKIYDAQKNKLDMVGIAYQEESRRNQELTSEKERLSDALEENIELIKNYDKSTNPAIATQNELRKTNALLTEELNAVNTEWNESTGLLNGYTVELNDVESALITTGRETENIKKSLDDAGKSIDGVTKLLDENGNVAKDTSKATAAAAKKAAKEIEKAAKETAKPVTEAIDEIAKAMETLNKEYNSSYNSWYSSAIKQLDLFDTVAGKSTDTFKISSKTLNDMVAGLQTGATASLDSLINSLDKAGQESEIFVSDFVKTIRELDPNIEYTMDEIKALFGSTAEETGTTTQTMIDNMNRHTDEMQKYNSDLLRLVESGFSQGFVATLADGSDESKKALSGILDEYDNLTSEHGLNSQPVEDFVWKFNNAFDKTSEAADKMAHTMAGIQTNFDVRSKAILDNAVKLAEDVAGFTGEGFDEVKNNYIKVMAEIGESRAGVNAAIKFNEKFIPEMEKPVTAAKDIGEDIPQNISDGIEETMPVATETATDSGENIIDGIIIGVENKEGVLYRKLKDVAAETLKAFNEELEIRSPSEKFIEAGEYMGEGVAIGVENTAERVTSTMKELAMKSLDAFYEGVEQSKDEAHKILLEFYNELTHHNKISAEQFESIFGDHPAFDSVNPVSAAIMDSMASSFKHTNENGAISFGLDLENVKLEVEEFTDIVYGLERTIYKWTDLTTGAVLTHGNAPGQQSLISNSPVPLATRQQWDEEYWKEYERISNQLFNEYAAQKYEKVGESISKTLYQISGTMAEYQDAFLEAQDVWELGGEAWDVYKQHIEQQGLVADLQSQVKDQYDRMLQTYVYTDADGVKYYNETAVKSYEELIEKLKEAEEQIILTGEAYDELVKSIEAGTAEIKYAVEEVTEEIQEFIPEYENMVNIEQMEEVFSAEQIGAYIAQQLASGFEVGVRDSTGKIVSAAEYLADTIKRTTEKELGIQSPSKVFRGYGKNTAEGFILGLEETFGEKIKTLDLNPPEVRAKISQYHYLTSLPVPDFSGHTTNNQVVNNNRTASPTIYITQKENESQYELARKITEMERRMIYG